MQLSMDTQLNNLMIKQYKLEHKDSNWTILFTVDPDNTLMVNVHQINHDDQMQNTSSDRSLDAARREWKHFVSCGYTRQ